MTRLDAHRRRLAHVPRLTAPPNLTRRAVGPLDAWWSIDAAERLRQRAMTAEREAVEAKRELAELKRTMAAMLAEANDSCAALVGSGTIDDIQTATRWDGVARVLEQLLDR